MNKRTTMKLHRLTPLLAALALVAPGVELKAADEGKLRIICFGAHPDDLEVAMGGTSAKLSDKGLTTLLVDLCDR